MSLIYLTNENIDFAVETVVDYLKKNKTDKQSITAIRLALEEVLITYQNKLGQDAEADFSCSKNLGRVHINISIKGPKTDPFTEISDNDQFMHNAMQRMGIAPEWSYSKNANRISFNYRLPSKLSSTAMVLIALLAGIIFGLIGNKFFPETALMIGETYLSPISSTILGLLGTLSAFLIFVSVASGIFGMGDMSTFSKIGGKLFKEFGLVLIGLTAIEIVASLFVYDIEIGGSASIDLPGIWNIILAIIPINIPQAFETCNALQIVFLAITAGIILLSLSAKVPDLTRWISEVDYFIQVGIEGIVKFMPVVIFISIYNMLVTGSFSNFLDGYKYLLLSVGSSYIFTAYFILQTSIKHKTKVGTIIKKIAPIYIIGISTSSTTSTFSTCLSICEHKLGINKQFVNVGVPLIQTLLKIGAILTYVYGAMFLVEFYHAPITISSLITLLISVPILVTATPAVPGGALSCTILLCGQLGLPAEGAVLLATFDFICDRNCTATQCIMQPNILVKIADKLHLLDENILRKP